MRVQIFQADTGGSGFYRATEPARVVRALGLSVQVDTEVSVDSLRHPDGTETDWEPSPRGAFEVKALGFDADLLVAQRPLSQGMNEVVKAAKRQGMRVCVELDDDFHNVHPDNVAAMSVDPKHDRWHNKTWLTDTLKYADWVTVSTPALLKYAPYRDGVQCGTVVRNYLPERALSYRHQDLWGSAVRVGWTGTIETHPQDLARARGLMAQAPEADFRVVGYESGVARQLGIPSDRVRLASPWTATVEQYWGAVKDAFDIGIAPLETSKFNKSKSWLKCAEYLTLGIPFVASPLPEYRLIQQQSGGGEIASGQAGWAKTLRRVIDQREKYVEAGLEWAHANTLEAHGMDWLRAWERAVGV